MAPLPENNTGRVWIDYTSGGISHSLLLRFNVNPILGNLDVVDTVDQIGAGMLACMWSSDAIVGHRYSEDGTLISLPYVANTGAGAVAPGTPNPESNTGFAGISSRSIGGRQYHADFFTQVVYPFAVYREDSGGMDAAIEDYFNAFNTSPGSGDGMLVGIDGLKLVFKQYLNYGQNAYWQRAQR
jgi:hypothetical protein